MQIVRNCFSISTYLTVRWTTSRKGNNKYRDRCCRTKGPYRDLTPGQANPARHPVSGHCSVPFPALDVHWLEGSTILEQLVMMLIPRTSDQQKQYLSNVLFICSLSLNTPHPPQMLFEVQLRFKLNQQLMDAGEWWWSKRSAAFIDRASDLFRVLN